MTRLLSLLVAAVLVLMLGACNDSNPVDSEEEDPPLEVLTVEDLPADPTTSSGDGPPSGTDQYTYFSLRDGEIVLRYDETERDEAESTSWDISFQATNIIVNGGTSGPGEGAAYIAEEPFEEVTEVDVDRLGTDTDDAQALEDWYDYNMETHIVSPLPGRTLVVRTADGEGYAKIRIVSYYEGAPEDPAESEADARHYTFDYVLQTDGSTALE